MTDGDYIKKVKNPTTDEWETFIRAQSGRVYVTGKKIGGGGFGKVFRAWSETNRRQALVFKEFKPGSDAKSRLAMANIRSNIIKLLNNPLVKSDGKTPISHFAPPIDIIPLPASNSFGYIMKRVDTSSYLNVSQLWQKGKGKYPDAKSICRFARGFTEFFDRIHARGWCYKDLNEGNIYIKPDDGDFWVIDCDNISIQNTKTVLGTTGYIAPEVYRTEMPDSRSDLYALAVFLFMLLVGAFPMDGPATVQYCYAHDVDEAGAAEIIYGSNAVFAFNPKDSSNAAYLSKDPKYIEKTRRWNNLPYTLRNLFLQAFVEGLPEQNRARRPTTAAWRKAFEELEQKHLVRCPKCGKYQFDNYNTCRLCGQSIQAEYEAVFEYISMLPSGRKTRGQIGFKLGEQISGRTLHSSLGTTPVLMAKYWPDKQLYTIKNLSESLWKVSRDEKTLFCNPGQEVPIKTGVVVVVDPKKYMLRVIGVRKL